MLKKIIILLSLLPLLAACHDGEDTPSPNLREDISLTRGEQLLLDANTDFSFRFFRQVCHTEQAGKNLFVSPLSASLCLSMMANGAAGNTLAEMQTVLGFPAATATLDDLNAYNRKLTTALLSLDNTTRIGIANSIWVRQGFNLHAPFADLNRKIYDAQVQELDFNSPSAVKTINDWCAQQTNDCIKEVIQEIPGSMCLYLINALYFKGMWKEPFKKDRTRQEDFTNADGTLSKVDMMNQNNSFSYTLTPSFSIAELPYGNSAFSMVLLLPAAGKTLDESLAELTADNWKEWSSSMTYRPLELKLPRFKLNYKKSLSLDMIDMGMKDAFDGAAADFSGISDSRLAIGLLDQFTYVNVDEEGTEAAAVTVGGTYATSVPQYIPFHADSPFAFMIREKSTGAILFMGKIVKL